jgi:hypothetical protein
VDVFGLRGMQRQPVRRRQKYGRASDDVKANARFIGEFLILRPTLDQMVLHLFPDGPAYLNAVEGRGTSPDHRPARRRSGRVLHWDQRRPGCFWTAGPERPPLGATERLSMIPAVIQMAPRLPIGRRLRPPALLLCAILIGCGSDVGGAGGSGGSGGGGTGGSGGSSMSCDPGKAACGGICLDLSSDAAHCGDCDNACQAGDTCVAGQCACPGAARPISAALRIQ